MTAARTEKLYLDHPYESRFNARVISAVPSPLGGSVDVVLNRSCFYPESGGQLPDRGRLARRNVMDVQETADGAVIHRVEGADLPSGEVDGEVDWETRFDHMQQHTGQHVLSRAFIETADLHTVSFHMGEDSCTIDLEGPAFDEGIPPRAEALANRVIAENRVIKVTTVAAADINESDLRRKLPSDVTEARLVEVDDFDVIPCCGTHVRTVGELGVIKVLKWENVKRKQRVHFKVGRRALTDYAGKHDIIQQLSTRLTTGPGEIEPRVEKLIAENQAAKKQIKWMSQRLARLEGRRLYDDAQDHNGVRTIAWYDEGFDGAYLRMLSGELKSLERAVALLASPDGVVVCCASDDVTIDFAQVLGEVVQAAGGSGGGRGGFAQFKLPANADMKALLQKVERNVRESL